jgi:zinc resistance-associated protein
MFKPMVVAAAALAIGGSSIVYAQQHLDGPGGYRDGSPGFEQRHRLSAADMAAFTDARIAALKAGLELTPDQAKNWPAFEQALRDMAKLRIERRQAREASGEQSQTPTTPFERMAKRADNLSKAGTALKQIADTGAPLYQSLDDAQKHRFKILAHMLRPHHHHMHAGLEGGGDRWWGHQGGRFGQDEQGSGGPMHHMMSADDEESQL